MDMLECLVLHYLRSATDTPLDPYYFAYRAKRSVEDGACLSLYHVLEHPDRPTTYTGIVFKDYSSAFSTIIPDKLFTKLRSLNVNP